MRPSYESTIGYTQSHFGVQRTMHMNRRSNRYDFPVMSLFSVFNVYCDGQPLYAICCVVAPHPGGFKISRHRCTGRQSFCRQRPGTLAQICTGVQQSLGAVRSIIRVSHCSCINIIGSHKNFIRLWANTNYILPADYTDHLLHGTGQRSAPLNPGFMATNQSLWKYGAVESARCVIR